jgi:hypothetical protein
MERLRKLGKDTELMSIECDEEVEAQPPNVVRARYGLPPANNVRRWSMMRDRQRRWEDRREREARKKAEEEAAAQQEERAEEDDPED